MTMKVASERNPEHASLRPRALSYPHIKYGANSTGILSYKGRGEKKPWGATTFRTYE
jgi:hypothetical protein